MNIYERLAKIQNQLKAPKSEFNKFAKYHYRTAENILQAVKPIAKENDCVIVITDTIEEKAGRLFIHSIAELVAFDFVPDAEGEPKVTNASGWAEIPTNKGMDEAQRCGTASSYARKYALGGLLGITNEKDSDAVASEQGEVDAKEQAMQRNQERLDAMENWRLFDGGVVLVKAKTRNGDFEWKNLDDLSLKALEYLKTDARFEGIGRYVDERIAIIKGGK